MKPVRMRIIIEGRLQGTNFRYHTQRRAKEIGVSGFVRTLSDGRIEIDIQGDQGQIEKMLAWCQAAGIPVHILLNKADKLSRSAGCRVLAEVDRKYSVDNGVSVQLFSALTRSGIDSVKEKLGFWFA